MRQRPGCQKSKIALNWLRAMVIDLSYYCIKGNLIWRMSQLDKLFTVWCGRLYHPDEKKREHDCVYSVGTGNGQLPYSLIAVLQKQSFSSIEFNSFSASASLRDLWARVKEWIKLKKCLPNLTAQLLQHTALVSSIHNNTAGMHVNRPENRLRHECRKEVGHVLASSRECRLEHRLCNIPSAQDTNGLANHQTFV